MSTTGFENISVASVFLLILTIAIVGTFIYLLAINIKYMKEMSYKIKIIMRAAFEKDSPLMKFKNKIERSNLNDTVEDPEMGNKSQNDIDPKEIVNILKKLADKGRSAKYCDILKLQLEKYNHLIMWPFTRNSEDKKYDLLRPLSRFYNLLNMTGALIIWTLVVFACAITYTYYTTISSASVSTLAIIVLVCGLVSSPCIIICIHMFYRIYMNTVKSVFSKAYYPDKYMKTDNDVDNSIECAVPVGCNVPADKSQQQVRSRQFNDDRQSNFEFEGGDDSKYLEEEKEYSHEPLPPISMTGARMLAVDFSSNQIYNEKSFPSNSEANINSKPESVNQSVHNSHADNDEDCSVYEVKSDENDEAIQNNEIFGLVENESKNSENIKTVAIFMILLGILIFAAAICCILVFNLSSTVAAYCIVLFVIIVFLDILVIRNVLCFLISLILWCRKRKEEKKLQKYLEIVIKKFCSEKWNSKVPLGGFDFKAKQKQKPDFESEENYVDGDRESAREFEKETGKDQSVYQYDETGNERYEKLKREAEARRQALLTKMRSTNGSNAFTDTNSKHRKRRLRDPDGILGFGEDGMSDVERPAFQRDLTREDIERILKDNPELVAEFDNERQRWLELGEEDPNNINPLSDYNALLVSKMQKGYDDKADDLINNFRSKNFNNELAEVEKQRQNELQELEMDRLEMMGQAVAFANSEGMLVRKKIKQKKKSKKSSKVFILDTPYGKTKYFKRKPSPKAIEENKVMFQNQNNLTKKQKAKAKKLHGDDNDGQVKSRSGSSIVEGDEVMFETGFGPNKVIESDGDEMDEADMVFYQKDDMTNFSKNLGINKLKSRLSLMNFRKPQDKLDDQPDGIENSQPHFGTAENFSPGPKRKFIQKKQK